MWCGWMEQSDASAPQRLFYSNVGQELLLGDIDKATTSWVVQGCFKLYVGETLTEISKLFGLRTCRCGVWIVISTYVGKHNYLLSMTTDAWLRQPNIGFRQYFKSKHICRLLGWVLPKLSQRSPSAPSEATAVGDLREVRSLLFMLLILIFYLIFKNIMIVGNEQRLWAKAKPVDNTCV